VKNRRYARLIRSGITTTCSVFVGSRLAMVLLPPALLLLLERERKEERKREKFYIYLDVTHTYTYNYIYIHICDI
jgi:hypothetical protein